jgi:hypothetical protein
MSKLNLIQELLNSAKDDEYKAYRMKNISAGRRMRRSIKEIKSLCDQIKKETIEIQKASTK